MSLFWKIACSLLGIAAVAGLVVSLQMLVMRDPFARFKGKDLLANIGIQMIGVQAQHYVGAKLVAVADVERIDVRQDRQFLDFKGIRNGKFLTKQGEFSFSGDSADFNEYTHQLSVTSGAKLSGKNVAVVTPAFMYDQNTGILSMPGTVEGRLYEGNLHAANFEYDSGHDSYTAHHIVWIGALPKDMAAEVAQQGGSNRNYWSIRGDEAHTANGKQTFTNASATDGNILVKAPLVERDEKTDVITATGTVHYFGEKANVICDKAVVYRKEKRAVFTGHVHMLVKPKDQEKLDLTEIPPYRPPVPAAIADSRPAAPQDAETQQEQDLDDELRSSKTTRKYPIHVKAEKIEYWYEQGERHAIITGDPQAYQELAGGRWRRLAADSANYDGEKELLSLLSFSKDKKGVHAVDSIGDAMLASKCVLSTKEDDDQMDAYDSEGQYVTEDQDLSKQNTGGSSGSGSQPAPGGQGTAGQSTGGQGGQPNTKPTPSAPPKPPPTSGGG